MSLDVPKRVILDTITIVELLVQFSVNQTLGAKSSSQSAFLFPLNNPTNYQKLSHTLTKELVYCMFFHPAPIQQIIHKIGWVLTYTS